MEADQGSHSVYQLTDVVYDGTAGQGTSNIPSSANTITGSFYDGKMNPMYDFDSPYMSRDYSGNCTAEQGNITSGEVTADNVEVQPTTGNNQVIPRGSYSINEVGHISNMYYGPYTYSSVFHPYDDAEVAFPSNGQDSNFTPNVSGLPPFQQSTSMEQVESPVNNARDYYNCDTNEDVPRTTCTLRGTSSAASDCSPPVQQERLYIPAEGSTYSGGNQAAGREENCNTVTPTAINRRSNPGYYAYNTPVPEGEAYVRTYMNNSFDGSAMRQEYCYNTWRDARYPNYVEVPVFNTGQEYMVPRRHVVQAVPYSMIPNPYTGNAIYNLEGVPLNGYLYDHNIYSNVAGEAEYYNTGAGYIAMGGYLNNTINGMNVNRSGSILNPSPRHVQPGYEGSYSQPLPQEGYFSPPPIGLPSPRANLQPVEYDDDPLDLSPDAEDGEASQLSIEAIKNINRCDIDFLKMNDTLWQTLRNTGMFKLGNKGRAVLKSKISKQLKLNPKLRLKALGISGVRRATTRQLYQLAQVCGIKSHLK